MSKPAKRTVSYRKYWDILIDLHGSLCFYCGEEGATQIDHIVPWSWDGDDSIDNLVPACAWCNMHAYNKVFSDVWEKRNYILSKRKKHQRRSTCTRCELPFVYKEHSSSPFLCPECYDREYETSERKRTSWKKWLDVLDLAGFVIDAHRSLAKTIEKLEPRMLTRKQRINMLAWEIDKILRPD